MSGVFQTFIGSLVDATKDIYYKYVTLLLPGNGTNSAQNNTFIDSSTNNFTIARNGNTTQGTFSPFGANWSNYFDGTGDYLDVASTASLTPSGDFTIEFWVYTPDYNRNPAQVTEWYSKGYGIQIYSSNSQWGAAFSSANNSTYFVSGIFGVGTTNAWQHVCVFRSGNNYWGALNGTITLLGTSSSAPNTGTDPVRIGDFSGIAQYPALGYISNVRYVNGTAVYGQSNFTPPTAPLTAISGTQLLTCQSNRLIDNSTNNFTITRNGDVSVQRFSPFSPTDAYSTSVIGGSGYFDGTGDWLTAADNAAFQFGTGDFTVECWMYLNAINRISGIWTNGTAAAGSFGFYITTGNVLRCDYYGGAAVIGATTLAAGQWYHFAASRSGTTTRLFVNGVQDATNTSSNNNTTQKCMVGNSFTDQSDSPNGYISNIRVVKGTAVYTSNFTPPTSPLTAITNTSLLLNFTNAGIIDNAMMNDLETVGNAQISTAQSKFGGSSIYFDETGDYLTVPISPNMSLGTGDFTIECWVRFAVSTVGNGQGIYQLSNGYLNSAVRGPALGVENSVGDWTIYHGTTFTQSGTVPAAGVWYHTAIVRSSGTTKLYVNGASIISVADATNYTDQYFVIGGWYSTAFLFNGYIDDLRITKGIARYTSNFTPPTQALPRS